jgi:hypothetical protein
MSAAARYRAACAALALPVWRPGMLSTCRYRFAGGGLWAKDGDLTLAAPGVDEEPDFTDPATVGVLLAAAREAWQAPYMHVVWMGNTPAGPSTSSWWSACIDCRVVGHGPTEADALIAALEAAAARRGGQP